jgi:predicted TIM-barrel fold metal-dependent hydrolase
MQNDHWNRGNTSRRELLKDLGALGAGSALAATGLLAQSGRKRGRIDVHHHMLPPFQPNFADRHWTPEVSLAAMEKFGTETAVLSLTVAAEYLYDGTEKSRAFARRANEYGAKIVSDNPKHFGLFAALPFADVDGSLKEIDYVYSRLKPDGIGLFSDTGDKWPGDPTYMPIWEELNRRKAIVFFHPTVPKCCHNLVAGVGDGTIEFDFDTTRAITSLLFNGVLSKFPDVRIIVNHSGAAVPVLAGRIKDRVPGASSNPDGKFNATEGKTDKIPNGTFYELRKLYYECAHAAYPAPLAALQAFAPMSQCLYGTDFPIEPMESTANLLHSAKLSSDVRLAMDRGNAERLWPRFKA